MRILLLFTILLPNIAWALTAAETQALDAYIATKVKVDNAAVIDQLAAQARESLNSIEPRVTAMQADEKARSMELQRKALELDQYLKHLSGLTFNPYAEKNWLDKVHEVSVDMCCKIRSSDTRRKQVMRRLKRLQKHPDALRFQGDQDRKKQRGGGL